MVTVSGYEGWCGVDEERCKVWCVEKTTKCGRKKLLLMTSINHITSSHASSKAGSWHLYYSDGNYTETSQIISDTSPVTPVH